MVILSIRFYLRFEHPTWENPFDRALRVRDAATEPSSRLPNRSISAVRLRFRRHTIYRRKTVQRVRCTVLPAMLHFERTWMPPRPKTRNPRRYARSREVGSRTVRTERNIPAKTDRCRRNAACSGIAPERKPDPVCGKINGLALLGIPRRIFPKDAEAKPQVAFRHRLGMPRLSEPAVPKRRFFCTWPCENTHPAEAARPGHGWAGRHRRTTMARAGRPGAARRGTRLSGTTRPGQRTRQRSRARTRPGDRAGGRGTTGTQPERTRSTSPIRAARARNETERPEGRSARMPRMRLNARS